MSIDWVLDTTPDLWAARHSGLQGVAVLFGNEAHGRALNRFNPNLQVLCCDPIRGLRRPNLDVLRLRRWGFHILDLPGYRKVWPETYRRFLELMGREVRASNSDIVTSNRFAYEWQRNLFQNFRSIPRTFPVSRLFDQWADKPVVVISAGPSLNQVIETLREMADRVIMVAVGSTVPKLHRCGITPDVVIGFDGGYPHYSSHFHNLQMDALLVWDHIIHPKIPRRWTGPQGLMRMWPLPYFEEYLGIDPGYVHIGPTIAITALDFAVKLGGNPIIFVGQDLAYTDGKTHADGVYVHMETPKASDGTWKVPAVGGGEIATSGTMRIFIDCFQWRIQGYPNRRLINSSFGAQIQGMENLRLEDALSECPPRISERETFRALYQASDSEYNLPRFKEFMQSSLRAGERLLGLAKVERATLASPGLAAFSYIIQPIITRNRDDGPWLTDESHEAMRYSLPYLWDSICTY